jgi:hypothetical protein
MAGKPTGERTNLEQLCGAPTRTKPGTCRNGKIPGLNTCRMHTRWGRSKRVQDARLKMAMIDLVTPAAEDDAEINPFVGYVMEIRRTVGAIRFYEEKIAELNDDDGFWGKSKEVFVGSGEFPGVDETMEAKPSIYVAMWMDERKHLSDLHKTWIAAKLDERRFAAEAAIVDKVDETINAVIVGLNRNPRDPDVRNIVRLAMMSIKNTNMTANASAPRIIEEIKP